jgi:hypothetical protein
MGAESPPSALGARGRVASEAQAVHIWAWRVPTGACTVAQRALASRTDVFLMQRILTKVKTARSERRNRSSTRDRTGTGAGPFVSAPPEGPDRTGPFETRRGDSRARSAVRPSRKSAASRTRKPHPGSLACSLGRVVPGALPARARGGRGGGGMPLFEFVCQLLISRDLINVPPSDASSRASARICRRRDRGEPSCPASCPWVPPT